MEILFGKYAYRIIELVRSSSMGVDVLCYVCNFNLKKKSDNANLIFIALKDLVADHRSVRVILDFPREHKPNYHPVKFFTRRFLEVPFEVRYAYSKLSQHSKIFIFDRSIAVAGSHNWTTQSVVSSLDVSFVIDDPISVLELCAFFDTVWRVALEVN